MEFLKKIVDLYNSDLDRIKKYNDMSYVYNVGYLKDQLKLIKKNPPKDLSLKTLDDYFEKEIFASVLCGLDPKDVLSNFGRDVFFWTILRSGLSEANLVFSEAAGDMINIRNLNKAKNNLWQSFFISDTRTIIDFYGLIEYINSPKLDDINLERILKNNLRENVLVDNLKRYSLEELNTIRNASRSREENYGHFFVSSNEAFMVYLDSPAAVGLFYDEFPAGVLGLVALPDKKLLINQIQGVNKKRANERGEFVENIRSRNTSSIYFRNAMFDLACCIGKNNGFEKIGMISAKNNKWTGNKEGIIHLPEDRAIKIYDEFAKSLGMKLEDDGNYYMNLF